MEQANQYSQSIPSQHATKPLSAKPQYANLPQQILSAWTALEVLSPNSYDKPEDLADGDESRVARFTQTSLPWELSETPKQNKRVSPHDSRRSHHSSEPGETPQQNKRLYYQVILGSIRMQHAIDYLFAKYKDDRP